MSAIDQIVDFTAPRQQHVEAFRAILAKHNLICLCGLPFSGKTKAMDLLSSVHDNPARWSQGTVFGQIFNGEPDMSYSPMISKFERDLFAKLVSDGRDRFWYEGWLTSSKGRRRIADMIKVPSKALLVFWADESDVVARIEKHDPYGWTSFETQARVRYQIENFEHPKRSEGWHTVIYVNTFGKNGIQFLKQNILRGKHGGN